MRNTPYIIIGKKSDCHYYFPDSRKDPLSNQSVDSSNGIKTHCRGTPRVHFCVTRNPIDVKAPSHLSHIVHFQQIMHEHHHLAFHRPDESHLPSPFNVYGSSVSASLNREDAGSIAVPARSSSLPRECIFQRRLTTIVAKLSHTFDLMDSRRLRRLDREALLLEVFPPSLRSPLGSSSSLA